MCLGTLSSAMLLGVMSPNISPAPFPGPGNGAGLMLGDMTPGNMAEARVLRHNQLIPGSSQQSSCPLGRLLRGGWTPTHGHFRA